MELSVLEAVHICLVAYSMGVAAVVASVSLDHMYSLFSYTRVVQTMDQHHKQCSASWNTAWMDVRRRGAHDLGYFASLTLANCHPYVIDFESQIPEMGFHPCSSMPVLIGPLRLVLTYPLLVQDLPASLLRLLLPFREVCLLWLVATDSSAAK